jgi:endonuclease III-like uncharacterized protein
LSQDTRKQEVRKKMNEIRDMVIQNIIQSIKNIDELEIQNLIRLVLSYCDLDREACKRIQMIALAINYAIDKYLNQP